MNPKWGPIVLGAFGALALVAGLVGLIFGSDDGETIAAPTTAVPVSTVAPTSTVPPTTLAPTTTTVAPTTEATTTTTPPDQTVEEFFSQYVAAIESGDVDFLLARLHPVVLEQPNADLCRAFIEREILALGDYTLTGDVTGPVSQNVAGTTVPAVYSAPVSFVFQGQSFEGTATFAADDGQMRWFTECR